MGQLLTLHGQEVVAGGHHALPLCKLQDCLVAEMEDKVLAVVSIPSKSYCKIPFPKTVEITLIKVNVLWLGISGYALKY